ncbi:MAG: class I SAM-dependent methyltransferase [Bdellovibrionales bacterium]|nr:class I SAM-dependent methyltransferase [Bdellovibrionales bacterium]
MNNDENVVSFLQAGSTNTPLGMSYLVYALQVCQSIRPGGQVLDLGCGPGTLLCMLAGLMPTTIFTGVDLSDEMLNMARKNSEIQNLINVNFLKDNMVEIKNNHVADHSMDTIISTLAMHHLPDLEKLTEYFVNIKRMLKPDGQVLIADYGRLKRNSSMDFFAYKYRHQQSEILTTDLLNSLKAAFSIKEIDQALRNAGCHDFIVRTTLIAPFMITIERNPTQNHLTNAQQKFFLNSLDKLDTALLRDFKKLVLFMNLGGHKIRIPK